jgi:hypothetical protein
MRYIWALIAYLALLAAVVVNCGGTGNGNTMGSGANTGSGTHSTGSESTSSGMGGGGSIGVGFSTSSGLTTGSGGSGGGATCPTATTCAEQGANCGAISDGCGGILMCGNCMAPEACGAGNPGKPNVCGQACTPGTCQSLGYDCGMDGDGCGGIIDCGNCMAGQQCGAGGTNKCGNGMCMADTCQSKGYNCGVAGDGCGGMLSCGSCGANQTCVNNVCQNTCVPKTCQGLGLNCGPVADGCGGLLMCGFCAAPQTCGGGGMPNICGTSTTCTGLCLQQQTCANPNVTTTLTGTVYAPNGTDPMVNALVYIPNGGPAPTYGVTPFQCGVTCGNCSASVSGSPLVSAVTGVDGKFKLTNVPVGMNIPLVIQLGRWRRQVTIPNVPSCMTTAVPANLTNMPNCRTGNNACPAGKAKGDIPLMAFATGSVDTLECVMAKIGVDQSEFTVPAANCGGGRVHLYTGVTPNPNYDPIFDPVPYMGGATATGNGMPTEDQLWTNSATLNKYDMVLFPCQGSESNSIPKAAMQNVVAYANAGGRIFGTHYSYDWFVNRNPGYTYNSPFATTASWAPDPTNSTAPTSFTSFDQNGEGGEVGYINTGFPDGNALAQWLQLIGATQTTGQINLYVLRHDFNGVVAPSLLWISLMNDATAGNAPMHYTFDTPVGAMPSAQCGKAIYDDFHVENAEENPVDGTYAFPSECGFTSCSSAADCTSFGIGSTCTGGVCMTPQEKLLEYMLFDLASCVSGGPGMCQPKTCAQQNINCGPAGDGCGNVIQCGSCGPGQTCGGGGIPSVCGTPMCTPKTCAQLGFNCGPQGDGCGGSLMCGSCGPGETCGGGGPGMCGMNSCTPKTCAQLGFNCGPQGDGCGGMLNCGSCGAGETCGGGGTPGKCGNSCTPKTCVQLNATCGMVGDGCGGVLNCGSCVAPLICGYNSPNQCGSPGAPQ